MCLLTPPGLTSVDSHRSKELEEADRYHTDIIEAMPRGWQIVGKVYGAALRRTGIVPTCRPRRRTGRTVRHGTAENLHSGTERD